MSKFLDRFNYLKTLGEKFSGEHGQTYNTNRDWEDGYRDRWQHDKIVRSTHGVNCTGSCKLLVVSVQRQSTEVPNGQESVD